MSNLPIACTLSTADLADAKARYRAAADLYTATVRFADDHADISLTGDTSAIRDLLTEMIARENACCPFLAFETSERSGGVDVRLSVLDNSGLERGILRESIATFFPNAAIDTQTA